MAALPNSALVSLEAYLDTRYDPDVEFVDGVLVERNLGDWLHSLIQSNVLFVLRRKYRHLKGFSRGANERDQHAISST